MPRPTSTHEQREACRAVALQLGVREAARKLGLNESRVQSWSMRYNWFPAQRHDVSKGISVIQDCNHIATNGANLLADYGKTTKMAIAKSADKAAISFSEMPSEKVIEKSGRLLDITKVASTIHGWQDSQATSALNLNVLSGGRAIVQVNENKDSNEPNDSNSIDNTDV